MLFKALTSKKDPVALIPFLLLSVVLSIWVMRNGVAVYVPEDASRYYTLFANWVVSLKPGLQVLVTLVSFSVVGVLLYRLTLKSGVVDHASKTIPLFLVFYSLVAVPGNIGMSPPLLAMVFLVPAIQQVILAGNVNRPHQTIFNAGFLAATATLVAFPLIVFLPSFFIALWVYRLYRFNYQAVMASGMLLPWIYAMVTGWIFEWYPYQGVHSLFGMMISGVIQIPTYILTVFSVWDYLLVGVTAVFMLVAFFRVYSRLGQKLIQTRYMYRALMWLNLPVLIIAVVVGVMAMQYIMLFGFFLTIVGSSYLASTKRTLALDLLLWAMLLVVIISYFY
jgi:hypothetical protein